MLPTAEVLLFESQLPGFSPSKPGSLSAPTGSEPQRTDCQPLHTSLARAGADLSMGHLSRGEPEVSHVLAVGHGASGGTEAQDRQTQGPAERDKLGDRPMDLQSEPGGLGGSL